VQSCTYISNVLDKVPEPVFGDGQMAKKANEIVPLQVRMRRGLLENLQSDAKRNDHSLNAEIVGRLAGSYEEERKALDFQTAVAAISGGGDNAQLLSMISAALLLSAPNSKKGSTADNMDTFSVACAAIIAAHSGQPLPMISIDKLFELPDNKHRGYLIAQTILCQHDLPPVIDAPPPAAGEKEIKPMSLAALGLAQLTRKI
jgi:hypothetical protein